MIKTARKYNADHYGKGRHTILALENSFHGRTITTLSATGQDVFHRYFDPFTDGFSFFQANDPVSYTHLDVYKRQPYSLYSEEIATFGEDNVYDQADSAGFINLFGLPLKVKACLLYTSRCV